MDFLPDIERFVRQRFRADDYGQVRELLQSPAVSTPRVMRSVLFLSNGSLTMLRHHVRETEEDVRTTLVAAEYTTEVSETPIYLRDMSLPFTDVGNLGPKGCKANAHDDPQSNTPAIESPTNYHHELSGSIFVLGSAQYSVSDRQSSKDLVTCERCTLQSTTVVRLPLMFVLEQLAETVDMTQVGFTAG
jgi:hypothetical protein